MILAAVPAPYNPVASNITQIKYKHMVFNPSSGSGLFAFRRFSKNNILAANMSATIMLNTIMMICILIAGVISDTDSVMYPRFSSSSDIQL
jgi:hypothetical protein